MKKTVFLSLIAVVFFTSIHTGSNAQAALRTREFNLEKGLAIGGYDPVAYFTQQKAVKGSASFAAVAEGVTYHFASAANRALFVKDYKKYEPQYGGWCAYAMGANNEKVEVDPETFTITGNKLYLFYHSWTNNTLTKWNKMPAQLMAQADKNWKARVEK